MAAENIIGSWFRYFPDHYLWSQLMSGQINIAAMGGSNFHEIDQIGKAPERTGRRRRSMARRLVLDVGQDAGPGGG